MQPSVFISYRRADTGGHAGRLFDRLSRWFDAGEVFFDVGTFDPGDVFPERIERAIRAAKVVLVVIGPGWLEELNRRAAGKQTDHVRQEVAAAIQRQTAGEGVLVVPVLMGGAGMPSPEALHSDLPGEIGRLSDCQAHAFQSNQADWDHQFVQLREAIARVGGVPKPRFRSPSEVEQPYHALDDLLSFHFQDPENRLQELYESLEARSSVAAVARCVLHGMGGVGKTQLALKYTLDYRDRYAGVWWFRAESEGALQADAGKLCEHARVFVPDGERPSHALKRWLEREEGRWLLVFDNAAEPVALCPHLPQAGNHHLIVTSRNPVWGGIAAPVELDIWTTEQGVRFLAGRLSGGDREEPAALVKDLGGLPLALEQAASYLEATGVTAGVYRRLLDGVNTEGDILDETNGNSATGYGRSVASTLSVAFEKLSPPARRLLRLCAFAAPEPVPEWLFREAGDLLSGSLANTVGDDVAWNRIVAELRRYGLVGRISDEETGHALVLHRLTQQVVRTRLAKPAEDCGVFQAVLASACTGDPGHPDHWPRYAALAEHVIQLDRFSPHGSLDPEKTVGLLNQVALFLRFRSVLYTDAVRLLRRAIDIANGQWGDSHPDTLTSMNNLALTLRARGDLGGALKLQERALRGHLRLFGEEHPDTLASLRNLATVLKAQGDHSGVQELDELRWRALGELPDLKFRRIRLENWMNFVHAEVAIQDRIFLVGPNASGKSNFLDAFRFLKDLASSGGGLQEAIRKRGGMDTLRSLAAPWTPTVTIRVELEEADEETDQGRRWEYELAFKQGSHGRPLIEKECVRRNGERLLERPNQDDRDDSARLMQTWIEQVNANREFRELAECFRSIRYLHIVPQIVREPGRLSGRVGDPFGGDFLDRMERTSAQARAARLRHIGEALRIAVPQLREIEITRDADGRPRLRGRYRHWNPQGAWQTEERFSDGTLRLIGLLWAAMDEGGPLLLEKPELSLHEEIVRVLPQVLIRIQHETRRQVFLCTHSSDLLGDEGVGLDEVLLLVPGDGGTDITSANSHQDIRDLLEGGIPLGDIVIPWTQPEGTYRLALLGNT